MEPNQSFQKTDNTPTNDKFLQIQSEAYRLHKIKDNPEEMFESLTNASRDSLQNYIGQAQSYENIEIQDRLRIALAEQVLKGAKISERTYQKFKSDFASSFNGDPFGLFNDFTLLLPLIITDFSFDLSRMLDNFGNQVLNSSSFQSELEILSIADFYGVSGQARDSVVLLIGNSNSEESTNINYFGFNIDSEGIYCAIYRGSQTDVMHQESLSPELDMVEQVNSFLEKHIQDLINIDRVEYREIGCEGKRIFKISHGGEHFPTQEEIQFLINNSLVLVHGTTPAKGRSFETQYESFARAEKGDFFYLCWGNKECLLIGQFVDEEPVPHARKDMGEGNNMWMQRRYKFLYSRVKKGAYRNNKKWWTPNDPSTCIEIPTNSIEEANRLLFREFFQVEFKTDSVTALDEAEASAKAREPIMINEDIDAKLEVQTIAKEMAGIIDNLGNNKGQMLGIFGSWGRGKTFLYEQLVKVIDSMNNLTGVKSKFEYEHITFNAWKYQETEAIWAHLYGVVFDKYIGENTSADLEKKKLFDLNIERKGRGPLNKVIFGVILSAISLIVSIFFFTQAKQVLAVVTTIIGAGGLKFMNDFYNANYKPVKEIISNYTSAYDYKTKLGFQEEIQSEFKTLINFWLKKSGTREKRLLLFVDDIDRCSEQRIIQVIDALRVMLDDDDLIKKIVVLVAVDEVLLERAIEHKYKDFDIPDKTKDVVNEYMDKLFIGGVKLPKLSKEEQAIILKAYAIDNEFLEKEVPKDTDTEEEEIIDNEEEKSETPAEKEIRELDFSSIPLERPVEISEFFLLEKELEMLETNASELSGNVTPRQLRIYMYRYLLAKNIASEYLINKREEGRLSDTYCHFLAKAIAKRSNHYNGSSFAFTGDLSLDQLSNESLKKFTPKLIEIVVPY